MSIRVSSLWRSACSKCALPSRGGRPAVLTTGPWCSVALSPATSSAHAWESCSSVFRRACAALTRPVALAWLETFTKSAHQDRMLVHVLAFVLCFDACKQVTDPTPLCSACYEPLLKLLALASPPPALHRRYLLTVCTAAGGGARQEAAAHCGGHPHQNQKPVGQQCRRGLWRVLHLPQRAALASYFCRAVCARLHAACSVRRCESPDVSAFGLFAAQHSVQAHSPGSSAVDAIPCNLINEAGRGPPTGMC